MKFYLNKKLLFIDMRHVYSHALIEGEDRLISVCKSLEDAELLKRDRIAELNKRLSTLERVQSETMAYIKPPLKSPLSNEVKALYPTDAELAAAIRRQRAHIKTVRVVRLETEP